MEETLIKALKEAGKIIKENFNLSKCIEQKSHPSQVLTQTDLDSEKIIINTIKQNFPNHNILSEEKGFEDNDSEYTWVIDPLDGTSNFAVGIPWFGVIISVLQDSFPILAGVYLPMTDELYFTKKGFQTTKNNQKLFLKKEAELKNILFSFSLDNSQGEKYSKLFGKIVDKVRNVRSTNSVLDFCLVMENKFGASLNLNTKIWDIAGPSLLLNNSGAQVTDFIGKDLEFDLENPNKDYIFFTSNRKIHLEILEILKEQ